VIAEEVAIAVEAERAAAESRAAAVLDSQRKEFEACVRCLRYSFGVYLLGASISKDVQYLSVFCFTARLSRWLWRASSNFHGNLYTLIRAPFMSVPPTTVGNGVIMVVELSGTCRAVLGAASKAEKLNRRTLGNDANQAPDLADSEQQKPKWK
jgi:hypothetical protein